METCVISLGQLKRSRIAAGSLGFGTDTVLPYCQTVPTRSGWSCDYFRAPGALQLYHRTQALSHWGSIYTFRHMYRCCWRPDQILLDPLYRLCSPIPASWFLLLFIPVLGHQSPLAYKEQRKWLGILCPPMTPHHDLWTTALVPQVGLIIPSTQEMGLSLWLHLKAHLS